MENFQTPSMNYLAPSWLVLSTEHWKNEWRKVIVTCDLSWVESVEREKWKLSLDMGKHSWNFNSPQFWKTLNYPKAESLIDIILPQYVTHGLKWKFSLLGPGRSLKSITKQRKEAGKKVSVESPVRFDASKKWLQAGNTANNSKWFNDIQWNVSNLSVSSIKWQQEDKESIVMGVYHEFLYFFYVSHLSDKTKSAEV